MTSSLRWRAAGTFPELLELGVGNESRNGNAAHPPHRCRGEKSRLVVAIYCYVSSSASSYFLRINSPWLHRDYLFCIRISYDRSDRASPRHAPCDFLRTTAHPRLGFIHLIDANKIRFHGGMALRQNLAYLLPHDRKTKLPIHQIPVPKQRITRLRLNPPPHHKTQPRRRTLKVPPRSTSKSRTTRWTLKRINRPSLQRIHTQRRHHEARSCQTRPKPSRNMENHTPRTPLHQKTLSKLFYKCHPLHPT